MNSRSSPRIVRITYSPDFVLSRLRPSKDEYLVGLCEEIVTPELVITISTRLASRTAAGADALEDWELRLASLLLSEADLVLPTLLEAGGKFADPAEAWLYLALAWIYEHPAQLSDVDSVLDDLWTDLGCSAIVYEIRFDYMQRGRPPGDVLAIPSLARYVLDRQRYFSCR